jgi:hypothetical protein
VSMLMIRSGAATLSSTVNLSMVLPSFGRPTGRCQVPHIKGF